MILKDEKKHIIEITVAEEDAFQIPWVVIAANGEYKAMPLAYQPVLPNLQLSSENYGNLSCLAVDMTNAHVNYCKVQASEQNLILVDDESAKLFVNCGLEDVRLIVPSKNTLCPSSWASSFMTSAFAQQTLADYEYLRQYDFAVDESDSYIFKRRFQDRVELFDVRTEATWTHDCSVVLVIRGACVCLLFKDRKERTFFSVQVLRRQHKLFEGNQPNQGYQQLLENQAPIRSDELQYVKLDHKFSIERRPFYGEVSKSHNAPICCFRAGSTCLFSDNFKI